MKYNKFILPFLGLALICTTTACAKTETTYRFESELAAITDGRLDSKDLISNGFFVCATGGFAPADMDPLNITYSFDANEEAKATIVICVLSGNTFGNPFDLNDADYSFSMNGQALGVPSSVTDYQGNATTNVPKEDFTEGTGFVYFTYEDVSITKGANEFIYQLTPGNGAFKHDYIDITTTAELTLDTDSTLVDNYNPDTAFGE